MGDSDEETKDRGSRLRGIAGIVLAIVAALLVWMSVNTVWLHERIFDTDNFVETLAPLPQEPAVSTAIALHTTEALGRSLEVEERVAEALPDPLEFLAPKFVGFAEEYVFDLTLRIIESDAFSTVWRLGLERMHETTIGILEGDEAAPDSGDVGVNLDGIVDLVFDRLEERGVDLFAEAETSLGEVVFVQAETLAAPRRIVGVFNTAVWVFPLIAFVVFVAAVVVDWDRVRSVRVFGFATAIVMLLGLGSLRLAANVAGGSIESEIDRAAAGAIWDALLEGYLLLSAIVGFAALAIGIVAWGWRRVGRSR